MPLQNINVVNQIGTTFVSQIPQVFYPLAKKIYPLTPQLVDQEFLSLNAYSSYPTANTT
ncbi:unnamed protein product [Paramecium octaurelia]|uniref:Uncharacterized protein n=1 Tax=Paramecium octaurelia TaxID=43137 RepID=A0A8S1S5Z3_PAROT|nr:unnamed protein product [Paramecium octaurelia]